MAVTANTSISEDPHILLEYRYRKTFLSKNVQPWFCLNSCLPLVLFYISNYKLDELYVYQTGILTPVDAVNFRLLLESTCLSCSTIQETRSHKSLLTFPVNDHLWSYYWLLVSD